MVLVVCVRVVLLSMLARAVIDSCNYSSCTHNLTFAFCWSCLLAPLRCARRVILLPLIVERAKKCLDFTTTLYIIHVGMCFFYDGVPRNWEWYMLQMVSLVLMVVLGELPR